MAQESVLDTDNGIIITNNVELSTNIRHSSGNSQTNKDEVPSLHENNSLRRHNISISSIDSNNTSSCEASTSESETDDDVKRPDCTDIDNLTNEYLSNGGVSGQEAGSLPFIPDAPGHNISSIAIKNSTNVRIGNTQEFHAPVTIQQFMMDEERRKWTEIKNGIVNDGFVKSLNDTDDGKQPAKDVIPGIQKKLQNYYFIGIICCCLIVAFVLLITFVLVHANNITGTSIKQKRGDGEDSRKNIPINSTIDLSRVNDTSIFRFVTRDEWIAQPPNNPLTLLELPSTRVIIAHTATEGCNTQAQCTFRVRFIQTFHIESRNWDDIGYNFLIGGDGAVYEGRGWLQQGAHTLKYNQKSIGIAFIGTFNKNLPPPRAISACLLLIQEGVDQKYLSEDYKLYGHRQLIPSESPGEALYNVIKNWTHWSSDI